MSVNPVAGSTTDGWLLGFRDRPNGIVLARLDGAGGVVRTTTLPGSSYVGASDFASVEVAGEANRYLLAWLDESSWSAQVWVRRVDTAAGFSLGTPKSIAGPTFIERIGAVAYDTDTRSHWCVVHHEFDRTGRYRYFDRPTQVTRIGHDGGVVEKIRFAADGTDAFSDVIHDPGRDRFAIVSTDQPWVLGRFLEHSTQARNYVYGTPCAGGTIAAAPPYAGSEFWRVYLSDPTAANQVAVLRVSTRAEDVALGPGFGTCRSYVDTTVPGATGYFIQLGGTGFGAVDVALPDNPVLLGFLFCQWIYLDNVSGTIRTVTTAGLAANVQP